MLEAKDFVQANLYESEEAVIRNALRSLLRHRPDLRVMLAVHRYETEDLSLARAASLAGVSWPQMRQILVERGVELRLGSSDLSEALDEIQTLRNHLT